MKNKVMMIMGLLGLVWNAKADVQVANALTSDESQKIAEALETLKDRKVLTKDQNDKFDIDKDVIQKLKSEGFLKNKRPSVQTVCHGGGGHSEAKQNSNR